MKILLTVLLYVLFFIFVASMVYTLAVFIPVYHARSYYGEYENSKKVCKKLKPISDVMQLVGIACVIVSIFSKQWVFGIGPIIIIPGVILYFLIAPCYDWLTPSEENIRFKNDAAKEAFYHAAGEEVFRTKRNSMGYLTNVGTCPVCGKDVMGVEPYYYHCPYCNLTVEITDEDVEKPIGSV